LVDVASRVFNVLGRVAWMVEAARSTVDHSDIRGSGVTPAVMVVIRRELPPTT